jgi:hypothetical protein
MTKRKIGNLTEKQRITLVKLFFWDMFKDGIPFWWGEDEYFKQITIRSLMNRGYITFHSAWSCELTNYGRTTGMKLWKNSRKYDDIHVEYASLYLGENS